MVTVYPLCRCIVWATGLMFEEPICLATMWKAGHSEGIQQQTIHTVCSSSFWFVEGVYIRHTYRAVVNHSFENIVSIREHLAGP